MNQLTKFRLKRTIDHENLFLRWKWLLHTLQFLLSLLLFSFFLSKSLIALFSLCILRSESFLGFSKKHYIKREKMAISYELCWVWHIWVILHMRGKPNLTNLPRLDHMEEFANSTIKRQASIFSLGNDFVSISDSLSFMRTFSSSNYMSFKIFLINDI